MPQTKKQALKNEIAGGALAFVVYYISELCEEGMENLIALTFTAVFSGLLIVTFTVLTKVGIKFLIKLLLPLFKRIIYREGNDKMKWLKNIFSWIRYNWKSLVGTTSSAISGVVTTIAVNADVLFELPAVMMFGFNFTPFIAGILVFAGVELGVVCKGFETIEQAKKRVNAQKEQKKADALVKEAKKEIKAEDKLANQTQTQKEKEDAKRIAKEKADAEKKQAEEKHRAELEQAKAKLRAEIQSKS